MILNLRCTNPSASEERTSNFPLLYFELQLDIHIIGATHQNKAVTRTRCRGIKKALPGRKGQKSFLVLIDKLVYLVVYDEIITFSLQMSSKKARLNALKETIGEISLADMRCNIKKYEYTTTKINNNPESSFKNNTDIK